MRREIFYQWREVILPLLVFVGLIVYRQISQMIKARRLKDLARLLNGEMVIRPFSSPRIKGSYMGLPFHIVFVPGGRTSSGMLVVTFEYPCTYRMEIYPAGTMPRIGDLLSGGKVMRIGEEGSPDQLLVRVGKDPEKAQHYVMNSANQELLVKAFRQGFVSVRYSDRGISLTRPGKFLQEGGVSSEELMNHLALAAKLGERL